MICEKCKSKKATLFYADEGGVRHALCASCGESINKIGQLTEKLKTHKAKYIPEKTLYSFFERQGVLSPYLRCEPGREAICSSCGAELKNMIDRGRMSCSECYECFEKYLFLPYRQEKDEPMARMPSSRRAFIDKRRALEALKADIKIAVEKENYELAASLRDKVKKLECSV